MIEITRLLQQLNNTGLQNKDTPLYQLLRELIRSLNTVSITASGAVDSANSSSIITQIIQNSLSLDGLDGQDGMLGLPGAKGDIGATGSQGLPGLAGISLLFDNGNNDIELLSYPVMIGPFKVGSILFYSGKITEDNTNLFWDNVNKRLGLGTAAPGTILDIRGDAIQFLGVGGDTGQLLTTPGILRLKNVSAGSLTLGTNNADKFTINSAGEVVIGGGSPTSTVQLVVDKGGNTNCVIQMSGSAICTAQFVADNGLNFTFKNVTNGSVSIGSNNITRITIAAGGDVTIAKNLSYDTSSVFSWNTKSVGTVYQAASDGLVVFIRNYAGDANDAYQGKTDNSNPPTTIRAASSAGTNPTDSFTMPVKKGDYWTVSQTAGTTSSTVLNWVPLGTGG